MRKTIICKECGKEKPHRAFGLCDFCYSRTSKARAAKAESDKKYRESEKGKSTRYKNNHKLEQIEASRKRSQKHREEKPEYNKNWFKTHPVKTREYKKKDNAKRLRDLYWIKLFPNPFHSEVKVNWHHIDNSNVVAIPKDLHELYSGMNREDHRDILQSIVNQVYFGGKKSANWFNNTQ